MSWGAVKGAAASFFFTVRMPRSAVMVDKPLGILQFVLRLLVFCYIIGYVIIYKKGYCMSVPLVGSMRMTLRAPEFDDIKTSANPSYCCTNTSEPGCFAKGNVALSDLNSKTKRPCWYTHRDLSGVVSGSSVTLATRLQRYSRSMQQGSCDAPQDKSCMDEKKLWLPDSKDPYADVYIAYVENYTISMTHGFTIKSGPNDPPKYIDMAGMTGEIVYYKDGKYIPFKPCDLLAATQRCLFVVADPNETKSDILSLGTLLYAARELSTVDKSCRNVDSTSPTDCYDVDGSDISSQSKRDVGIMLEVIVTYVNNVGDFGIIPPNLNGSDIKYRIEVRYKHGAGYNEIRAVQSQNMTHRFYDRLYGTRMNVVQTGVILVPDTVTTIVNLMTAFGLLAVCSLVVTTLVETILPIIQQRWQPASQNLRRHRVDYAKVAGKAVKQITFLSNNGSIHVSDSSVLRSTDTSASNSVALPARGDARQLLMADERIHTGLSMIKPSDYML